MLQTNDWDTSNQQSYGHMHDYPFINSYNYHDFAKQQSLLVRNQDYHRNSMYAGK